MKDKLVLAPQEPLVMRALGRTAVSCSNEEQEEESSHYACMTSAVLMEGVSGRQQVIPIQVCVWRCRSYIELTASLAIGAVAILLITRSYQTKITDSLCNPKLVKKSDRGRAKLPDKSDQRNNASI